MLHRHVANVILPKVYNSHDSIVKIVHAADLLSIIVSVCVRVVAYALVMEPVNFAPQVGVFEIVPASDHGNTGSIMRQVLINPPVYWCPTGQQWPLNLIGNYNWYDDY